ncbi:MAG TPA: response regulator [Chromatiales bacterium]|nr:response regulator [Chromatiales bacterium]
MPSTIDTQTMTLPKPRILVVDDSRTMRKAMRRLLCQDFDVVEAEDGEEAWKQITEDQSIQVVFSDLMMPNMNGFQLLRNIRESIHSRINQLPVIIITGHEDDEKMRRQSLSLGATDFITKPFDSLQLKARAKAHAKSEHVARKLEQATLALEQGSTIDPLTGLANERYLKEHGPELLSFALRQGQPISVLRLNVDKYQVLYRKKGKQVAEKVLVNIGRILSAAVRAEDTVARVGLDKFAIVMPGASEKVARKTAEKIHLLMQKTGYRIGNARFRMTISAGVVTPAIREGLEFDEILQLAEARLKKAIAEGGNRLIFEEDKAARKKKSPGAIRHELTVDEALVLIKAGELAKVKEQLPRLICKVYPLMNLGNKQLRLGLDGSMIQLKERLEQMKQKC